jgi:hypothetical protein
MVTDEPLLALDNVSLAAQAGISGRGFCTVRILDRVSLAIHAGQLLVLRGGYENGCAALLSVIAGDERVARRMTGDRFAMPGLAVRSGCIPADLIPALLHAWTSAGVAPWGIARRAVAEARPETPPVYLLRASHQTRRDDIAPAHWLQWSSQLRQRAGTIVIAEKHNTLREEARFSCDVSLPPKSRIGDSYEESRESHVSAFERIATPRVRETRRDCRCRRPIVRLIQLGFGRVLYEEAHGPRLCRACSERTAKVS